MACKECVPIAPKDNEITSQVRVAGRYKCYIDGEILCWGTKEQCANCSSVPTDNLAREKRGIENDKSFF